MTESANFQTSISTEVNGPDESDTLSAQNARVRDAWIHLGEVCVTEGRKLVEWWQEHKGDAER